MNNNGKKFFQRTDFYLTVIATVLALVAVILYAANCGSEFNGGVVSKTVVSLDIVAVIFGVIAVALTVAGDFLGNVRIVSVLCGYLRIFQFVSFVTLLGAFAWQILSEYSLIGTILYPIVSGTVGDPVEPVLMYSYFISLIFTLVAFVLAVVAGSMQKKAFYKDEQSNVVA